MMSHELTVTKTKYETHDVFSTYFFKSFDYKPGQYLMIELDVEDPEGNTRPLSIASSPTEDFILLSTKIRETPFKQKLITLKAGDKVKAMGPMGNFILKEDAKEIVFLGGGIGITPFRDMIKYACDKKLLIKMTLLYSNKTSADICYKDEWPLFEEQNPNLKVVNTITDNTTNWDGRTGRINEAMIKEFSSADTLFYICGPPAMVTGLFELLKSMNIPISNIKIEKFAGY
ncbi:MAG: FAD-dependent oxidoreductase [Nanoarchaeota archaeon]|nr:FAD-dependent oxidoreductase [Nanoarchaeota archaeon]